MLNKIIRFSIHNKLIVGIIIMALVVWGLWSASKLPVDALPDITNNQVQVITTAPTLAAQEVEQFITYPVEKALANIQGVVEMRSFSRFGLSMITTVFDENENIYFARQLINERLKDAEQQIPKNIGRPKLAPVTTGLGEIYQYIIHPKKGSEQKYSAMDLRTMQDWIVGRQLSGIKGVAEVTAFGGISKQYEVAINPDRLKAMNTTIPEIFTALEKNNQNTGGAYIDRKPNAYFIRAVGLVKTFADIENIIVKQQHGIPVLIRDVATVQFGSPPRYGAMTFNGEKEVVGGLVLMMKGANSAAVVALVKERMLNIQKSLPADIIIEPFLDRTNLIDRAIHTVKTNLIEGALIVIFVLVIFLGNLRAGLIVASAIPLSLLFAMSLMNLFGVSANLMSLGAIDFGLIVDGAVIIVEATLHHLGLRKTQIAFTQKQMDEEVYQSASAIRNSAAFGEIIILIVYIPILTLTGIEGKMFRPMAQTVGFAILGALLLSLTYIPMMCALFLPKKISLKRNFSEKMMNFLQQIYRPVIQGAIKIKYAIITFTIVLFIISLLIFKNLGGEFIPTLEEGDFAIEFLLPQGSSLSQTTETMLLAQRMLRQFPEVKMVVGKTGAADIATDPMPPEASDLMVILKDKKDWVTTQDFYELADMMGEKLSSIPGVIAEPSQPIQMRFNEMMTGIRQDVAIKIFGENLDSLAKYADKVAAAIGNIQGITQPQVERIDGLPQITIEYDRARLAGYGLNIEDVNHVISTAFAGEVAGAVYENERKFDLVLRLDSMHRNSKEDVSNLYIPLTGGNQIPLSQVAAVSFKTGAAQISREAGKRRVYISFNVSGRDVRSVVEDAQKILSEQVKLPVGYYYTYGGTFENLQKASARLMIVVPIALLLIFFILYLSFRSLKDATLIFMAIPMGAIGGVFALLLRNMPFSISAGIGFIALFGVSVLNGIVLISTFNQLKKEGITDTIERVMRGTSIRLRPVLMTAAVAALGFLPMALSNGAGAEVQRPLATVVIGGLITATFLTLIVLPCLYLIFSTKNSMLKPSVRVISCLIILGLVGGVNAQGNALKRVTVNEAISLANNNLLYQINKEQIIRSKAQVKTATALPKTGVFTENEDLRPSDQTGILKIGVSQSLAWPGLYKAQKNLYNEQLKYQTLNTTLIDAQLKKDIRSVYYQLWYLQSKQYLFQRLDSIYKSLHAAAILKVKAGDRPGIDSIAANVRMRELMAMMGQVDQELLIQQQLMMQLLNSEEKLLPLLQPLEKIEMPHYAEDSLHPLLVLQEQNINIANAGIGVVKNENKPEFSGRFFSQRLWGATNPFNGLSVTAAFPLLSANAYRNKIKVAEAGKAVEQKQYEYDSQLLHTKKAQAKAIVEKNRTILAFYETAGIQQSHEIIKAATLAYKSGEVSFAELSQYLAQGIDIQKNYLENLNIYNQSVIQYNYYINQ
ncbi:MAG: CusA/CzcA family heavy metal efflux RND transporter [Sphingobacteriia bacterium]|nr:MAG: CusA/CzcA family heavy metal efflux RND transporter [Sphingobacteriia bacterium]